MYSSILEYEKRKEQTMGCSHIKSHNQVRGHRTISSHYGVEEYPGAKKHKQNQE